ncbi:MAG: leucine-rich repeat domain-containing protein [Cyclobacteriaceae bacterium]
MKRISRGLFLVFLILSFAAVAQKKSTKKPVTKVVTKPAVVQKKDAVAEEKKVRDIVAFLEFMLNTLGNSSTPVRDKEVLITESYAKIFRDTKVQVEDDLDNDRKVVTNKDIVAYLKDVNFFFHDVRFEFTIESITSNALPNGQTFFKVTTTRNLKGSTSDLTPVNTTLPRYIEINYNPNDQDLKIVSIYTHEFDEKLALMSWWNELSFEWQSIFTKELALQDSVTVSDLKRITALTELNISNNRFVQDLAPLSHLINLTSLNLSNTSISDLTPIRNLTELVSLNISNTKIKDLSSLKYSNKLERFILNQTAVEDILVVEKMPVLQQVEMSGTPVVNFTPLAKLSELQHASISNTRLASLAPFETLVNLTDLNLSSTLVADLQPLNQLRTLERLTLDSTLIRNLQGLGSLEVLKILSINNTSITDLTPLHKLENLEKIYCDGTGINQAAADSFMAANQNVLVIFNSEDLKVWWDRLSVVWQTVFIKAATLSDVPTKEELAKIPSLDSINLGGNKNIDNLEPLGRLVKLKVLIANNTSISDLSPFHELTEIIYLDISNTNARNLSVLSSLAHLKVLKADGSKIENVDKLTLSSLEKFYADDCSVDDITAATFLEKNPTCLLVYKTVILKAWWNNLSENWKEAFTKQLSTNPSATRENLHTLVEQQALHINDAPISDLTALGEYVRLKELHLSGTSITNITFTNNILFLKSLHVKNSPLQNIESVSVLTELEDLDISNTPVDDVYELWKLKKLTKLNCAGTQLKKLDALEKMENLTYLDCSNTNVSKLSALDYLPLKTLKCYNTKVPNRVIENFKASHPDCNVVYYR